MKFTVLCVKLKSDPAPLSDALFKNLSAIISVNDVFVDIWALNSIYIKPEKLALVDAKAFRAFVVIVPVYVPVLSPVPKLACLYKVLDVFFYKKNN